MRDLAECCSGCGLMVEYCGKLDKNRCVKCSETHEDEDEPIDIPEIEEQPIGDVPYHMVFNEKTS